MREHTAWRRSELPISTANSRCSELPPWQLCRRRTRRTPAGPHDFGLPRFGSLSSRTCLASRSDDNHAFLDFPASYRLANRLECLGDTGVRNFHSLPSMLNMQGNDDGRRGRPGKWPRPRTTTKSAIASACCVPCLNAPPSSACRWSPSHNRPENPIAYQSLGRSFLRGTKASAVDMHVFSSPCFRNALSDFESPSSRPRGDRTRPLRL